jgi:UDP-glucuronate 4-epimerase
LAAQAGVRYSISNPEVYTKSNLLGFFNIIELCKNLKIKHLVFASSSSVYGSGKLPFSEKHRTDSPLQYYAATKKSNEIMSFSYSSLYKIPTTCLRYFTVYGPWGRPDMAIYKFYNLIKNGKTINIYNKGKHKRDFTFIEDAALMTYKALIKVPKKNPPFQILNISNGNSEKITDIIKFIQKEINKKAKVKFLDLQLGDIKNTRSSISKTRKYLNYFSKTKLSEGIKKFILWYESR